MDELTIVIPRAEDKKNSVLFQSTEPDYAKRKELLVQNVYIRKDAVPTGTKAVKVTLEFIR